MTAPQRQPGPRTAATRTGSRFAALVLAVLLATVGCKSKGGGGGMMGGSPPRSSDPLVVGPGRIPKQNLPVPDRGTAGGPKGRGDPLLGSPTGRPSDRGAGYTDDPERWKKGPYTPGPGGTPAALAARTRDDGEGLKIETPGGVPLTPTGGTAPIAPPDPSAGSDSLYAELAQYGVKRGDYSISREGGQVVFRVKVPITAGGASRGYTGTGPTEAAAVKQILDQVKADRK
jgi:hypothetical protein